MSDLHQAAAISGPEVEPHMRTARAEVARLSLAVRAARREAELRERAAADLDDRARGAEAVLEESLRELIQERRHERALELVEQRTEADRLVAEAREQAGWAAALELKDALARASAAQEAAAQRAAEDEQHQPLTPSPPVRLRVVGAEVADPEPDLAFAATDPIADEGPAQDEPASPPAADESQDGAQRAAVLGSGSALVPAEELREVVQAAVAEGLRQAIEHAVATMHLVPAFGRPVAPDVRPVLDGAAVVVDGPSFVRRLLYLDVMLPLIAAVIVLVLLLAWTS